MSVTRTYTIYGLGFTHIARLSRQCTGAEREYCSQACVRLSNTENGYRRNPEQLRSHDHKGYLSEVFISRYAGRCSVCVECGR